VPIQPPPIETPAPDAPAKPADGKEAPVAPDPGQPWCIAYSPDGKSLAMVSGHIGTAGTYLVWDLATQTVRFRKSDNKGFRCVTYSHDGKLLAIASYDGSIRLIHPITGKEISVLRGHKNGVNAVAFSPDDKSLASSSLDKTGKVWDLSTGKEKFSLPGHTEYVLCIAYSPDGKFLATGSGSSNNVQGGGDIKIWDATNGKEKMSLEHQKLPVEGVTFSPDGKTLASMSWDGGTVLWNLETGKEQLHSQINGACMAGAFSADGKVLATACHIGGRGEAKLREASSGTEVASLAHPGQIWKVCFSPDGKTLATCSWDRNVRLWELASKQERAIFPVVADNTYQAVPADGQAKIKPVALTTKDLDVLWTDLAGSDAKKAYQAILKLAQSEKEALPYLKDHMLAVKEEKEKPVDAQLIAKLIADLDNDDSDVRDKATDDLKQMGKAAEPAIREALKGRTSAEVRIRLELLLDKVPGVQGEPLRIGRATEALEFSGSPAAKELLTTLAKEAVKPEMKAEAKAALERLAKRPDSSK
jgi:sugar lactone lactonase YvrE